MDKLKEVLKYQFWILLGVALILPVVGWFLSTSGLVSEAAARTETLKKTYNDLNSSNDDPNTVWAKGVEDVNKDQEKQKLIAWNEVWERQKPMMTWPARMVSDMSQLQNWHQEIYRQAYRGELEKIRQIVKPMDETSSNGLLEFSEELLPAPDEEWRARGRPPSRAEIEAAQEDLWLLKALLECIAEVNKDSNTPFEAPIRRIDLFNLRGGSTSGANAGSSNKSASGGDPMNTAAKGMDQSRSLVKSFYNRSDSGTGGGGGGITNPAIDADDVLGPESSATSAPPTSKDATKDMTKSAMIGQAERSRYRQETREWKTRGFELQVMMDHRNIPDLLVSLSNCDWPVGVLRVQEADAQEEDLVPADSPNDSRTPYGAGMMGGMGSAGMNTMNMKSMMAAMPTGRGAASGSGGTASATGKMGAMSRPATANRPVKAARTADDENGLAGGVERSPLDDPNLATVSIVGVIYIFKPPDKPAVQPGPAPGSPGAPSSPADAAPANGVASGTAPAAADSTDDATQPAADEHGAAADEDEMKDSPAKEDAADEGDDAAEKPDKTSN